MYTFFAILIKKSQKNVYIYIYIYIFQTLIHEAERDKKKRQLFGTRSPSPSQDVFLLVIFTVCVRTYMYTLLLHHRCYVHTMLPTLLFCIMSLYCAVLYVRGVGVKGRVEEEEEEEVHFRDGGGGDTSPSNPTSSTCPSPPLSTPCPSPSPLPLCI